MNGLAACARWWLIAAALCLVGLGLATYLTVTSLGDRGPACGLIPGCVEVAASEYSRVAGFPTAGIGVIGFAAMLLGSLAAAGLERPPGWLRLGLGVGAAFAAGFSVYLTVLEFTVIRAVCVYCFASAVVSWTLPVPLLLAERATRRMGQHEG